MKVENHDTTKLGNCRKQQLLTDPQHDVKNIFCLKLFASALILRKLKKAKLKILRFQLPKSILYLV
jgi:hypothetical protein